MSIDYRLFRALNSLATHGHVVRAVVRFYAANAALIFPIALVLLWIAPGSSKHAVRTAAVLAALAALLALGANQILNHLVDRPRPYATHSVHLLLPRSGDASFPSDHTAMAFAVVASLWPARRRLAIGLGILATALALSRVIAGVHYPGDVAGGAAVGIAAAVLVRLLARKPIDPIVRFAERITDGIARLWHRAAAA
jgi:undecaprenyl-diphosphatase